MERMRKVRAAALDGVRAQLKINFPNLSSLDESPDLSGLIYHDSDGILCGALKQPKADGSGAEVYMFRYFTEEGEAPCFKFCRMDDPTGD